MTPGVEDERRLSTVAGAAKVEDSMIMHRGGHKKPKPNTETELTGTETEFIETELTDANFGA